MLKTYGMSYGEIFALSGHVHSSSRISKRLFSASEPSSGERSRNV